MVSKRFEIFYIEFLTKIDFPGFKSMLTSS